MTDTNNTFTTLEEFKENIPTRKNESYKYTNFKKVLENFDSFDFTSVDFDIESIRQTDGHNYFFIGGELDPRSDKTELEYSNSLAPYNFKSDYTFQNDFLVGLNTLSTKKHAWNLKAGVAIEKPVFIFHIVSNEETHLLNIESSFNIGKNADLKVVEVYINTEKNTVFYNTKVQSTVEENAHFLHIHHQDLNTNSSFGNSITAQVAKNANYQSFTTSLGGQISRTNIHVDINDEGAEATASGVYTLQDEQHSDISSYISHNAPHTESHQLYKGIMNDKSRGVFTGLIKVQKDAQLINSNQLNKNLLLTKGAHANSRPQLEIFADDVKCSHGSTTGQLSDQELFYFESRGIRPEKAKMMLARAYTYDVLLKINNKTIRDFLHNEITEKFEKKAFQ